MTNKGLSAQTGDNLSCYNGTSPTGWTGDPVIDFLSAQYYPCITINGSPEAIDGHKNMTLKEKFVLAITSEPQKSFRKAGITNGDGLLTDEGERVFLSWLLSKNADAFKAEVVDKLLEEDK